MKPCLLISEVPLKSGEDYTAPCGKKLVKAEWVAEGMLPGVVISIDPDMRATICRKCMASESRPGMYPGKYLYLAVDGERVRQMEES